MRQLKIFVVGAIAALAVAVSASAAAAGVPATRNDYVKTAVNKKVTFGVLANDSPAPGDQIDSTSLNINTFPDGYLELSLDAKFTYTPLPGFNGTDSFTYQVCSASSLSQCSIGNVSITVGTGVTTTTTTAPAVAPPPPPPPAPPPPPTVAAAASDANALPRTGSSSATLLLLGLALCAVGAVSIRATKRWGGTTDE